MKNEMLPAWRKTGVRRSKKIRRPLPQREGSVTSRVFAMRMTDPNNTSNLKKNSDKNLPSPAVFKMRRAFTMVEMLVAMAIIALLAAISIPAIQSSINKSNQAKCAGRLKSCMAAIHSYMADTAASQLILYYYDGATTKLWNTDLITGGYLKLKDSQDPVWPVWPLYQARGDQCQCAQGHGANRSDA